MFVMHAQARGMGTCAPINIAVIIGVEEHVNWQATKACAIK